MCSLFVKATRERTTQVRKHPATHPSTHSSIHPFTHSSIHPFTHSSIYPTTQPPSHPPSHPPTHTSSHSSHYWQPRTNCRWHTDCATTGCAVTFSGHSGIGGWGATVMVSQLMITSQPPTQQTMCYIRCIEHICRWSGMSALWTGGCSNLHVGISPHSYPSSLILTSLVSLDANTDQG